MERVMGIEPTYSAWEADVLPLNYTRVERGFYAANSCSIAASASGIVMCGLWLASISR